MFAATPPPEELEEAPEVDPPPPEDPFLRIADLLRFPWSLFGDFTGRVGRPILGKEMRSEIVLVCRYVYCWRSKGNYLRVKSFRVHLTELEYGGTFQTGPLHDNRCCDWCDLPEQGSLLVHSTRSGDWRTQNWRNFQSKTTYQ